MSFNISKCGYLYTGTKSTVPCNTQLLLNNQAIPKVTGYKYLGVLFGEKGIDYLEQGKLLSNRVNKLRGAISWHSDTWPPRIRYNIFKTILTPTLEYSLPLMYAYHLDHQKTPAWQLLKDSYYSCINWIAGGNAKRQHITCNLLGILPFEDRCRHIYTRFYHHLTTAHSDNPVRSMLENISTNTRASKADRLSASKVLLTRFVQPPQLYRTALNCQETNSDTLSKHDLSLMLIADKRRKIVQIPPKAPKLLRITSPTERPTGIDCDTVLLAPAKDQAKFLAWRRGVFGWGRKCACGKRFNRGHTECMPYSSSVLTSQDRLLYEMDLMLMDNDLKFTIMDFLLNHRLWQKARTLLDFWYSTMAKQL
jgi:hypothetical protein